MSKSITRRELEQTCCNPIPLPHYPRGRQCRDKARTGGWMHPWRADFRETADPSVLYHDGKWILYPSCGMAYVTEDFIHWQHRPVTPLDDVGYAPTVVPFRGKFLLTACGAGLWMSDSPLGPFECLGPMQLPEGGALAGALYWNDPMLFADEDGALYGYWGLGKGGIKGALLDPEHPNRMQTVPKVLFEFDPSHVWERFGECNEDRNSSFVEGAWMLKHGRRYFLTYAAPGTEWRNYGMGAYVSESPLGPFRYQPRNPILRDPEGLVNGVGHGCLVRGPRDTLWAFYTCLVRNLHNFERRCGLDPAGFDAEGNLFVLGASDTPQWAPGVREHPELGNEAGLLPLGVNRIAQASSYVPGREPSYALHDSLRTFWQAAPDDAQPWLVCDLWSRFRMGACRIHWAEPGLDYDNDILPGPVQYRLEVSDDGQAWRTALDRTRSQEDLLVDYQVFEPVVAQWFRLVITGHARGIAPAILNLTLFGESE